MEVVPGMELGQYRIVEQIGRGGMATVYRAFQPGLDRYVAVKVLPAYYAEDATFQQRFRQEAQSISQLRHPNILAVFDYGEQQGVTFMVTELLPGGTLAQLLGEPLAVERVVELIGPIAAALDYAHARGMVHRDVKPSNILLAADGTPVLTDFGLARMVGSISKLTATGVGIGTPEYMAPEQAAGDPVTDAADRYSLGVVLYEMVTGRTPFQAETPIAVALAHLHKPLPLPRSINPALPETIETVLLKALAKKPEERYPTARAMVEALGSAGASSMGAPSVGVPAPPATAPMAAAVPAVAASVAAVTAPAATAPVQSGGGRRRALLVAGALGALVVIGGGLLLTRQGGQPEPQPTSSPVVAAKPAPAVASPVSAPAIVASPAAAPAPALSSPEPVAQKPIGSPLAVKPGVARGERLPLNQLLPHLAGRLSASIERDDFSNPANGIFTVPAQAPHGKANYENGSLVIDYTRKSATDQAAYFIRANRPASFSNGVIDLEVRARSATNRAGFNILFRRTVVNVTGRDVASGYFIFMGPNVQYIQLTKVTSGNPAPLAEMTNPAIQADGLNRVTIVADGPSLTVYVNGTQLLQARDEEFKAGHIALTCALAVVISEGEARCTFDDLRIVSLS